MDEIKLAIAYLKKAQALLEKRNITGNALLRQAADDINGVVKKLSED